VIDLSKYFLGRDFSTLVAVLLGVPALVMFFWLLATTTVRRLHDFDFSGWYALFLFIPVIGGVVWLVIGVRSPRAEGRYGHDPRQFRKSCDE
jgi:uncharacterized membrane protein YhaH (DUF805 family)